MTDNSKTYAGGDMGEDPAGNSASTGTQDDEIVREIADAIRACPIPLDTPPTGVPTLYAKAALAIAKKHFETEKYLDQLFPDKPKEAV